MCCWSPSSYLRRWVPLFFTCMPQWCVQYQLLLLMTALFSVLLTTGNTWNITERESCIPTSSNDIVMWLWLLCVAVFSFPPQSVSPTFFHMPQWCVQYRLLLLVTAMFSVLFMTGNTWNITEREWCTPTSSNDIVMWVWLLCVAVFSFPPQSVSPTFFHMPQWCVQYRLLLLVTAMFSVLFMTGNTWNITEREWCTPTSSNDIVMWVWLLCVAVSPSSYPRRWVPIFFTYPNDVCSICYSG